MYAVLLERDGYVGKLDNLVRNIPEDKGFGDFLYGATDGWTHTDQGYTDLIESCTEAIQGMQIGRRRSFTSDYVVPYWVEYKPSFCGEILRYNPETQIVDDFLNLVDKETLRMINLYKRVKGTRYLPKYLAWYREKLFTSKRYNFLYLFEYRSWQVYGQYDTENKCVIFWGSYKFQSGKQGKEIIARYSGRRNYKYSYTTTESKIVPKTLINKVVDIIKY